MKLWDAMGYKRAQNTINNDRRKVTKMIIIVVAHIIIYNFISLIPFGTAGSIF